jgi:hypothetical protein
MKMGKRSHWVLAFGATCILIALSLWVYGLPKTILFLIIALPSAGAVYALQRFARTSLSRWRGLFIFLGASCTGFVFFVISIIILRNMYGLTAGSAALTSLPVYLLGALLGGYLGNKLGKRVGMP